MEIEAVYRRRKHSENLGRYDLLYYSFCNNNKNNWKSRKDRIREKKKEAFKHDTAVSKCLWETDMK